MHRPSEKQHAPWVDRVTGQLLAAGSELEAELKQAPVRVASATLTQGVLSVAVAWHFTQRMIPEVVRVDGFPLLQSLSTAAERLAEFAAAPHGGTVREPAVLQRAFGRDAESRMAFNAGVSFTAGASSLNVRTKA